MIRPETRGNSDTMSDISECGTTGTSISGRGSHYSDYTQELQELSSNLGLENASLLYQERFRVDRGKFEQMLLGEHEVSDTAQEFFEKIMIETHTLIKWPAKMKVGARSKKDPYIRIAGIEEGVKDAKERIISVLDTKNNRVTMKLDVSYTDHSHIIGKGGLSIKQVMEGTGCHIHFPDSNRNNSSEKSNQVSIAGGIEGVEKARERIRTLIPLIFSFELPIVGSVHPQPTPNSPLLLLVQEKFKVSVIFRKKQKFNSTQVLVKGCEWESSQVIDATLFLIKNFCDSTDNVKVIMTMEISPHHHPVVLGKNNINIKAIRHNTSTEIMFPDAADPNIPSLKKSNFIISGNINDVYKARQQLMGSLPVVLMFDLPNETVIDNEMVVMLNHTFDVVISIKMKHKQATQSIIIKGIERNVGNIYEARRQILKLDEPKVTATIPPSYFLPKMSGVFDSEKNGLEELSKYGNFLSVNTGYNSSVFSLSPQSSSPSLLSPALTGLSGPWNHHSLIQGPILPPYSHRPVHFLDPSPFMVHQFSNFGSRPLLQQTPAMSSTTRFTPQSDKDSQGYSSLSSNSSSFTTSPSISPRNTSPIADQYLTNENIDHGMNTDENHNIGRVNSTGFLLGEQEKKAPGYERKNKFKVNVPSYFDYEQRAALAKKASHNKINPNDVRFPKNVWSGLCLSNSSPDSTFREHPTLNRGNVALPQVKVEDTSRPTTTGPTFSSSLDFDSTTSASPCASNHLDSTPASWLQNIQNSEITNLESLLSNLSLSRYYHHFETEEIDFETFLTLNETDLRNIGVSTFGARRRMLLAIAEINKQKTPFLAAPGAERKKQFRSFSPE